MLQICVSHHTLDEQGKDKTVRNTTNLNLSTDTVTAKVCCFPTVLLKNCVSQDILSPRNKPQSWICSQGEERAISVRFSSSWRLSGASLCWLILRLAITVVDPFCYRIAERLRRAHKYIFLRNSRQILLPVLDAHGIQITRLHLKYNALYYNSRSLWTTMLLLSGAYECRESSWQ